MKGNLLPLIFTGENRPLELRGTEKGELNDRPFRNTKLSLIMVNLCIHQFSADTTFRCNSDVIYVFTIPEWFSRRDMD